MPLGILALAGKAIIWLGRIGIAALAVNEIKKLTPGQKSTMEVAADEAEKAGISKKEQQKMVAATTYEQIEKEGKDPVAFWDGLNKDEQETLQFSPQSLQSDIDRTTFLGTAQTLAWLAAGVALGLAAFRGVPITLAGLSKIAAARQAGATAPQLMTIIEEVKMGILSKVWVPGFVGGIAAAGGWLSGSLANNMNDALLWGRIFLDQAHSDVEKAAANAAKGKFTSGTSASAGDQPKTIIRMTEEKKPQQFIGTLFSAKLDNVEQFERAVDDEIVDMQDLTADIKINLNRWLKSLPGRMGYSVVIRKDPVDEYGTLQSGIWATLTLFITHISGKTTPIDTILLGPVSPQVRLEIVKSIKTIEQHIPGMMTGQEVREITVPNGSVDIFGVDGERVTPSTTATTTTAPTPSAPAANAKQEDESDAQFIQRLSKIKEDLESKKRELEQKVSQPTTAPRISAKSVADTRRGDTLIVSTGGAGLNVRNPYGLAGKIVAKVADGTRLRLISNSFIPVDGFVWRQVEFTQGSKTMSGFIADQFTVAE